MKRLQSVVFFVLLAAFSWRIYGHSGGSSKQVSWGSDPVKTPSLGSEKNHGERYYNNGGSPVADRGTCKGLNVVNDAEFPRILTPGATGSGGSNRYDHYSYNVGRKGSLFGLEQQFDEDECRAGDPAFRIKTPRVCSGGSSGSTGDLARRKENSEKSQVDSERQVPKGSSHHDKSCGVHDSGRNVYAGSGNRSGGHFQGNEKIGPGFEYFVVHRAHPRIGVCRLGDFGLDDYQKPIASGGFGAIYKARHWPTNNIYALKYFTPEAVRLRGPSIMREEAYSRMSDHPNIGRYFCSMKTEDGGVYLVLEYYPGGDLHKAIVEGRLSDEKIVPIVARIASALHHLHDSHLLIHRDVKGENVMLADDGSVRLIDFGLSVSGGHGAHRYAGTRQYAAPSVIMNLPYGPEVDYYSLGILAYLMKTKKMPYRTSHNETRAALRRRLKGGDQLVIPMTGDDAFDQLIRVLVGRDSHVDPVDNFEAFKNLPIFERVNWPDEK